MRSVEIFHPRERPPEGRWPTANVSTEFEELMWAYAGEVPGWFSGHSLKYLAGQGSVHKWRFVLGCRRCRVMAEHVARDKPDDPGAYASQLAIGFLKHANRYGMTCSAVSEYFDVQEVMGA